MVGRGAAQARRPVSRPSSSHPDTAASFSPDIASLRAQIPSLVLPFLDFYLDSNLAPAALMTNPMGW